jgi:hypothetical protein
MSAAPTTSPPDRDVVRLRCERGSVTPLVIGMVLCLLLLGAGVTAATSAFLARQNLQHSCDGAADAAAGAAQSASLAGRVSIRTSRAQQAAAHHLTTRYRNATASARATADAVDVACTVRAPITFGSLFGAGRLTLTVHSVGRSVL